MRFQKGDKSKFSFAFGKEISDSKEVDFNLTIASTRGVCPNCGIQLGQEQTFKIVELISIDNGKHFVGYSDKGHTLKIDISNIPEQYID